MRYKVIADECVKQVLNTLVGCEPSHESPPFSINGVKNVTAYLINVVSAAPSP